MSKMREAMKQHLTDPQWEVDETSAISFSAGYAAAIAAVKEGGPVAHVRRWAFDGEVPRKEKNANGRLAWLPRHKLMPITKHKILADDVPTYRLPEDV